jgi:uncharacterized SAM-binding protein YcdF (DUF218 family)
LSGRRKVFLVTVNGDGSRRVLVVLGCMVRLDGEGRMRESPLLRRVRVAASSYHLAAGGQALLIASGGRHWHGHVEADAMAEELVRCGVPRGAIVRERLSMSTRENARFVAESLARRGAGWSGPLPCRARLVTSDWHMPRALMLFREAGVDVEGVPVHDPPPAWRRRLWRWGRERALTWVQSR